MAIELRIPALGESITQATVGTWLKKEGDPVALDEPVVEVESEKATVAVPAPATGVLARILKPSGATVAVGEIIGEVEPQAASRPSAIGSAGPTPASPTQSPSRRPPSSPLPVERRPPSAPSTQSHAAPQAEAPTAQAARGKQDTDSRDGGAPGPAQVPTNGERSAPGPLRAPPSLRRLIAERGLDAAAIRSGAVLGRADVERAVQARDAPAPLPTSPPPPPGERERAVPMTPLRRTVARRLLEAQENAAILTTFNELDMSRVIALREKHGDWFQEKHGVKLGFMSFFVKAAVEALRAWPAVNAEVRGTDIIYKDHYDVGVAVGGGKGLVVPVLRDADQLSFADIERLIGELAKKARENRITMQDLEGGTFTISNGGIYGSLLSTPILNPPQSGILGLHKIEKRAVVGEDDAVVVRPMMYVALSYDHRLVDGREAVSFLVHIKECIEEPDRMLFG
jgi:2-oxoglutarate dehydrogenase E2 component (dihydrolipoamide succinyltransferase)